MNEQLNTFHSQIICKLLFLPVCKNTESLMLKALPSYFFYCLTIQQNATMKIYIISILTVAALSILTACTSTKGETAHNHPQESKTATEFTADFEMFVEYQDLIVGHNSTFLLHFTKLSTYQPTKATQVRVSLGGNNPIEAEKVSDGIYKATLSPEKEGHSKLFVNLKLAGENINFVANDIHISSHSHASSGHGHEHEGEDNENSIRFLKEQAWKGKFAVEIVKKQDFASVIRCAGEVMPAQKEEQTITAKVAGKLVLLQANLVVGKQLSKGQALLTIVPEELDNNLQQRFEIAKANYESAVSHYERDKRLLDEKIVAKSRFETTRAKFLTAKAEFETISKNYRQGKYIVTAPNNGVISAMQAMEGQYVEAGTALLSINKNKNVLIKAELPKQHSTKLATIQDAVVRTEYATQGVLLSSIGGSRIPTSRNGGSTSPFIPIFFKATISPELIPGSYAEVLLLSKTTRNVITVPKAALTESQGVYYVYIQKNGENYEEREVLLGQSNGKRVEIKEGLEEGERIVSLGAYRVKRASLSTSAPAHSH